MTLSSPINFKTWIDEHRHLLKPPVGNKLVWQNTEFMVMVVGGPNARDDFHVNQSEEFFYQLEGDISLRVLDNGTIKDLPIKEGEIFLLPPRVPHSPQRPANTVGLVMERQRREGEKDGFQWYCSQCGEKLYESFITLTNIVTQLPPLFEEFYGNPQRCTCKKCGTVAQKREKPHV